ncbi:MAG TPA: GMC family oxidoreductase [Myxococcota bacterium]|nr:GMC family oxidoreductase [Myxococcota bacterium]
MRLAYSHRQGPRRHDPEGDVLGNRALTRFDFCVIGSGAGGGTAAFALTEAGKTVLVLEAGHNPFPGLDRPGPLRNTLHGNDELKYGLRNYLQPQGLLEPRTFRTDPTATASLNDDVNALPKAVGGAWQHADCKTPRLCVADFEIKSRVEERIGHTPGLTVPGFGSDSGSANFADWPIGYADLELFYAEVERLYGVQGADDNLFQSWRSGPHPMPPGAPMYLGLLLADAAQRTSFQGGPLHPHAFPASINSRFYDGRPPCVDCGFCAGFGCPSHAKGSPAVTTLRRALLSGLCQLRFHATAIALVNDGGHVSAVRYVDGAGDVVEVTADAFLLAASAIESARLCFLSPTPSGGALGNSSGQVGRNLMFHHQTRVSGFVPQRIHGQRGRAVSHGISDFRGLEPGGEAVRVIQSGGKPHVYLGGIIEFGASQGLVIEEDGRVMAFDLPKGLVPRFGAGFKNALRDGALTQHLLALIMQGEDAPTLRNRVDLDPAVKDVNGLPVARVTYKPHNFELESRRFYVPVMKQILTNAGAQRVFTAPCETLLGGPPTSRHVLGTLRMGSNPQTSVVGADGRFHDVDNLYACDGSVFPTSSGWNPTLTIFAVALRIARTLAH